mmetsp:Transcript_23769/g.82650  ORF Transcript_23769/g.82650 Transcript_23769/m.82650 type:complete len:214 (-) Transcript_23769:165-806(-)
MPMSSTASMSSCCACASAVRSRCSHWSRMSPGRTCAAYCASTERTVQPTSLRLPTRAPARISEWPTRGYEERMAWCSRLHVPALVSSVAFTSAPAFTSASVMRSLHLEAAAYTSGLPVCALCRASAPRDSSSSTRCRSSFSTAASSALHAPSSSCMRQSAPALMRHSGMSVDRLLSSAIANASSDVVPVTLKLTFAPAPVRARTMRSFPWLTA